MILLMVTLRNIIYLTTLLLCKDNVLCFATSDVCHRRLTTGIRLNPSYASSSLVRLLPRVSVLSNSSSSLLRMLMMVAHHHPVMGLRLLLRIPGVGSRRCRVQG